MYAPFVDDIWRFDSEIVRCDTCGLQFSSPTYDAADFAILYGHEGYKEFLVRRIGTEPDSAQMEKWCDEMKGLGVTPERLGGGDGRSITCLDVGCGLGKATRVFARLGFKVTGIDVNRDEVAYVRERLGLDARVLALEDVGQLGAKFDCVNASHIIEHVTDPHAFVRNLVSALADGGTIVLETPLTIDYGKIEERYGDIYHTLFFDHFTLGLLMGMHGFVAQGMRNLMFFSPQDRSTHVYVQGAFRREIGADAVADPRTIRTTRFAYDGLNYDALRWARSHLYLTMPRQPMKQWLWRRIHRKGPSTTR